MSNTTPENHKDTEQILEEKETSSLQKNAPDQKKKLAPRKIGIAKNKARPTDENNNDEINDDEDLPAAKTAVDKKIAAKVKQAEYEKKRAEEKAKFEAKKAEAKKKAEDKRKADEIKRAEEKANLEAKKAEAKKSAEEKKRADEIKRAEEKAKLNAKKAEAKKSAEAKKKADEIKKAKETEKSEENKKANEHKTGSKSSKSGKSKKTTEKSDSKDKPTADSKKNNEKWNIKQLGGLLFAKMLRGGASKLHANAEEVNNLNVFPVPDGDTGDNMTMTIESGVSSLDNIDTDDLAEVLKVASRGMLLGARGNSGVILSQFFAGMSKGLEDVQKANAKKLAHALELGVKQAYTSVMTPTEGTILTVAREAVEYAVKRLNSKSTVQTLFSDLVNEMNASLARTPEILPVLGEAGVVDSGGAGLLYIIDGLNRVLNGEDVEEIDIMPLPSSKANTEAFGPDSEMSYAYCTEVLVQLINKKLAKNAFDLDSLRVYLATIGDSIVVFQTETVVKIHVHTMHPDRVLRYMRKYGEFISVKIENMSLQHTELTESRDVKVEEPAPRKKYGIVAVSSGEGISDLFKQLGADQIVDGGQTNNPSTNDFIDAFDKVNADNIFVFPNNGNIVLAAAQSAEIYEKAKIYVVPSKSIGAGYVAMSTMSFDFSDPDTLMNEAQEAIDRIVSAYVSPAVRDADINGLHVADGDTMGIIAKEIVISGPDKMASTFGLIDILLADSDKFMITIFHGKDATIEERDKLAEYMLENYPLVESYYIDGGQDIYPFLLVAE